MFTVISDAEGLLHIQNILSNSWPVIKHILHYSIYKGGDNTEGYKTLALVRNIEERAENLVISEGPWAASESDGLSGRVGEEVWWWW